MDKHRVMIDSIELRQPPHYVKARAAMAVDIGSRFVTLLVIGLLLAGGISISQAMCTYGRLTASSVAAAEPSVPTPVAAAPVHVAGGPADDVRQPVRCASLTRLAHPTVASL